MGSGAMSGQLFCRKPFEWFELEASPDFPAFLCCSGWLPKSIGSVAAGDPMEVWNSVAAQEIRESILDGSFRFCDRERCSALQEVTGPVMPVDEIDDPVLLDIVRNHRTKLDSGPKLLNCSYDPSCNLQCPTCRTEKVVFSGPAAKPIELLQERLLDAFLEGLDWLYVTGSGDPIGSPTFHHLLKTRDLNSFAGKIHLHTNAQLLTPERWESLRPNVERVRTIEVSIDAATSETYRWNRPPGSWNRLVENMEFLASLRRSGHLDVLRISYVVQANNWREMPQFVEWGKRWAADEVLFARLTNWGTFTEEEFRDRAVHLPNHPDHGVFVEHLGDPIFHSAPVRVGNLNDLLEQTPVVAVVPGPPEPAMRELVPSHSVCDRPWTGLHVDDDGNVRPCAWARISCGSIMEETPAEIWNGPGFYHFREQMRAGRTDLICSSHCPILNGWSADAISNHYDDRSTPRFLNTFADIGSPPELQSAQTWIRDHWLRRASAIELHQGVTLAPGGAGEWEEALAACDDIRVSLEVENLGEPYSLPRWLERTLVERLHVKNVPGPIDDETENESTRHFSFVMNHVAAWRATVNPDLDLVFGYCFSAGTLPAIESFLDLCAHYRATPQFRLDDKHGLTQESLLGALEIAEKLLEQQGYPIETLAPVLTRVLERERDATEDTDLPAMVYLHGKDARHLALMRAKTRRTRQGEFLCVRGDADAHALSPSVREVVTTNGGSVVWSSPVEWDDVDLDVELELEVTDQDSLPSILARCERIRDYATERGALRICFRVNRALRAHWQTVLAALRGTPIDTFAFLLPYWEDGESISALDYAETIAAMIPDGKALGWTFAYGRPDVHLLGLVEGNQYPRAIAEVVARRLQAPKVSVIVPIHNRTKAVPRFCASLREQFASVPMEVIFVDDGSADDSYTVVSREAAALASHCDVTLLRLERDAPYRPFTFTFRAGAARQVGVEHSRGEYLVFIDPDQTIGAGAIANLVFFADLGFDVVIGTRDSDVGHEERLPAWSELQSWKARNESIAQRQHWWTSFFTGASLVKREIFIPAGGFDESLQLWGLEDIDLAFRLARANARVFHTRRARVVHQDDHPSGGGDGRQVRRMQRLGMEILYRKYLDRDVLEGFRWLWARSDASADQRRQVVPDAVRFGCPLCRWKGAEWDEEDRCPECAADAHSRLSALILKRWHSSRWPTLRALDISNVVDFSGSAANPFVVRKLARDERGLFYGTGSLAAGSSAFHVVIASAKRLAHVVEEARGTAWTDLARVCVHNGVVLVFDAPREPSWSDARAAGWECFRVDSYPGAARAGADVALPLFVAKRAEDKSHLPI
jgi:glycosyltransferase involved in cell wall biosynthesis/MoaA/NifB/PqqE/SkfB family radical SAM enzyme